MIVYQPSPHNSTMNLLFRVEPEAALPNPLHGNAWSTTLPPVTNKQTQMVNNIIIWRRLPHGHQTPKLRSLVLPVSVSQGRRQTMGCASNLRWFMGILIVFLLSSC